MIFFLGEDSRASTNRLKCRDSRSVPGVKEWSTVDPWGAKGPQRESRSDAQGETSVKFVPTNEEVPASS